jgi:hypothetical protein
VARANWTPFRVHDYFVDRPCRCCVARDLGLFAERLERATSAVALMFRSPRHQNCKNDCDEEECALADGMSALPPKADMCSAMSARGQKRTHPAAAGSFLSAFALHRFVRQPLELDPKLMTKGHVALCHYQARSILLRRNPLLGASTTPKKNSPFAS